MSLVADSGLIVSFARARRLDLLRQVAGELFIPDAVYEDIVVRGAGKPGAEEVATSAWIHRRHVQDSAAVDQIPPKLALTQHSCHQPQSDTFAISGEPLDLR